MAQGNRTNMTDILIVTAPYTQTFGPSLAPALLKACCEKQGVSAVGWDIAAEFNYLGSNNRYRNYYKTLIWWFQRRRDALPPHVFEWYTSVVKEYANRIANEYKPKALALSVLTMYSQRFAEDLCFHLRTIAPEIKIMLGGSGLDIFQGQFQKKWYELMLDSGLADLAMIGEGEEALSEAFKNNSTGVIRVPQLTNEQLDQIPIPDYSDYDFSIYRPVKNTYWVQAEFREEATPIFLITGCKGCVKNCTFCDVGKIWNKFRFRSGEKIAQEMIHLHEKYGADFFSFTDSLMNGALKTYYEMNEILAERLPDTIKYEGQMICRSEREMPEKHFAAMARAGCHNVSVGMESGSESVRMHMGKGNTMADVEYTTNMLMKYNIRQTWNIIAGYPTETEEDWKETMNLVKTWLPKSNGLLRIYPVGVFLLIDGAPITQPELYDQMQFDQPDHLKSNTINWTTRLNPGNTLETRIRRFKELAQYLYDTDPETYGHLAEHLKARADTQFAKHLDKKETA